MLSISDTLELIQEAVQDFHTARGNAHLEILMGARQQLRKRRKMLLKNKLSIEARLMNIQKTYHQKQLLALEKYIAQHGYMEIPTIDQELWQKIYNYFFKGHLDDFNQMTVAHVTVERLTQIHYFINRYKRNLGKLVYKDYPGRQDIVACYIEEKRPVLVELAEINQQLFLTKRNLDRCELAIRQLKSVHLFDFVWRALGHDASEQKVDEYMRGLFDEWDPVPYWFTEIITSLEEENALQVS